MPKATLTIDMPKSCTNRHTGINCDIIRSCTVYAKSGVHGISKRLLGCPLQEAKTCKWESHEAEYVWNTDCGISAPPTPLEGSRWHDAFKYCPYCGLEIEVGEGDSG